MSKSFLFWLIFVLWLLFGAWSFYGVRQFGPALGADVVLLILLGLLGWQVFGKPIT